MQALRLTKCYNPTWLVLTGATLAHHLNVIDTQTPKGETRVSPFSFSGGVAGVSHAEGGTGATQCLLGGKPSPTKNVTIHFMVYMLHNICMQK